MVEDVLQAQAVQQLLIPEALPHIPGFRIESEYRPAREVGGDFFQILAHPTDGSVLIVAGDVTGKGLQAGMLVALISSNQKFVFTESEFAGAFVGSKDRACHRRRGHRRQ
jgi:serine phosphatase RsbU (regulator of sigma subunit)